MLSGLAISRSSISSVNDRLIVDGLDASIVNKEFVKLLRAGGVHCVHKSAHTELDVEMLAVIE